MNLLPVFALSTVLPTVILAACIAKSGRERPVTEYLLAAIFVVIALLTVSSVILSSFRYQRYFPIAHLSNLTVMLLGPLFYLYVKSSMQKRFRFRWWYWLIFLPFVVAFSYFLYQTLFHDLFYGKHTRQLPYKIVETILDCACYVAVFAVLIRNGVTVKRALADFSDWRLTWIRFLYLSLIAISANKFYTSLICDYFNNTRLYLLGLSMYFIFICAATSLALYVFLNRQRIFSPAERYRDSALSSQELEGYYRKLLAFMDGDQPWLDPDLTLPRLAERSGIPLKTLSRVINDRAERNFNDFVNDYRIRESCRLLEARPNERSILEILYESGFNSKSTFNDAFKRKTGKTPSEFRSRTAS